MIEYLKQLVEDKEYVKALETAEKLLLNPDNTSWDLMAIYTLLCEVRFFLGEFYGAQVAGELATNIARELQAWDHFGAATAGLGVACSHLRQPEQALAAYYDYLAYVPYYQEAKKQHVMVLYNISIILAQMGQHDESLRTLQKAADLADALQDYRSAHGIRHAFISAHLQYAKLDQIPPLLAKCAHYLRHNSNAGGYMQSRLWHQVLRVRFALATNRPQRAEMVARRGLRLAQGWQDVTYEMHFLLAHAYEQLGYLRKSLEEAVRARSVAMEARRFDLELAAANYVYGLLSSHPDLTGVAQVEGLDD